MSEGEEVVIEEGDVGELPAELLEEAAEEVVEEAAPEEAAEEEAEEESAPEEPEETEPLPEPELEEEVVEEAAPIEPDPPEDLGPLDPEGIITELSPDAFAKLQEIWKGKGNPRQFDYQAARWSVYDNGNKFVRTGGQPGMDQFYGSLSIG